MSIETHHDSVGSETAWISMLDVFLITSIFLTGLFVVGVVQAKSLRRDSNQMSVHVVDLEKKVAILTSLGADLSRDKKELEKANKGLRDEVTKLTEAGTKLRQENERWQKGLADERRKAESLRKELLAARAQADRDRVAAEKLANKLKDAESERAKLDLLVASLRKTVDSQDRLLKDAVVDRTKREDEAARLRQFMETQSAVRKELVGLKGELGRVVFIVDRSGSMKGRWENTIKVVDTWLNHLLVKEAALITFESEVQVLTGKDMLPMTGAKGKEHRVALRAKLLEMKPDGYTNTLAALEQAYEYEKVDNIILFTDGAPLLETTKRGEVIDVKMRDAIYKLVGKHRSIPINVIGLGNFYGERQFTEFMLELAKLTNGSFTGR